MHHWTVSVDEQLRKICLEFIVLTCPLCLMKYREKKERGENKNRDSVLQEAGQRCSGDRVRLSLAVPLSHGRD